jgi:head-tail adaptor
MQLPKASRLSKPCLGKRSKAVTPAGHSMAIGIQVQRRTPTLQSGKLRHLVQIVAVATTQDSTGGWTLSQNVLYANVWASIDAMSGGEQYAAGQQISKVTHQIVIRYIGAAPSWFGDTFYLQGALVVDANGNLQQAQGPGFSASAAPTWAISQGQYTQDGNPSTGLSWLNLGPAPIKSGIAAKMQILHQGHVYQIEDVLNPDGRNKMLVMQCVEINDSLQEGGALPEGTGGGILPNNGFYWSQF